MATENRGVMVYLPSELEAKIAEYCTEYNITRRDKQGNIVTSLGSGIVAYLKSHLLSDIPNAVSDRPITGLTREEVLDLIASSTSSTPSVGVASLVENRAPDPLDAAVVDRLKTILQGRGFANEQKLSSSMGMERDEVVQLIQASEQKIMAAVRSMSIELRGELAEVTTVDDRVNTPEIAISTTTSQEKLVEDTVKSIDTETTDSSYKRLVSKELRIWVDLLDKDKQFSDIIQAGISDNWSNQEIVTKLFDAGYGKNSNVEPYTANLASAMKTAYRIHDSGGNNS